MPKMPKNAEKFNCVECDFSCSKKSNWEKHLSTRKHISATNGDKWRQPDEPCADDKSDKKFHCTNCNKKYVDRKGLWIHNKKHHMNCGVEIVEPEPMEKRADPSSNKQSDTIEPTEIITKELLAGILKQNNDLIARQSELQSQLIELAKERTVTNNTQINAHFNMNVYLNETCKDAINYNDFLKSIVFDQSDLQKVVQNGYVDGHTLLIKEQFEKLNVHERPIQCSDPKRGVTHIKNDNMWHTDGPDMKYIRKLTDTVTHKMMQQFCVWANANPIPKGQDQGECDDDEDRFKREKEKIIMQHLHVMNQVNGQEIEKSDKEIHKNIIKIVTIDKEKEKRRK